jgi:anaerobic ribonucleoside-triphosphate reductase activating protein
MHYGNIKKLDIANGEGLRTTLFVSGCTNRCPGCFQPETWSFEYGEEFNEETERVLLDSLAEPYVRGLTLLGGEPMEPANQRALLPFIRHFKELYHDKTLWIYTGNTYEELTAGVGNHPKCIEVTEELLSYCDVLVDGRFEQDRARLGLRFRGSDNQRIIDMNETRRNGKITIWSGCREDKTYASKEGEKI